MKSVQSPILKAATKAPIGIAGFDEIIKRRFAARSRDIAGRETKCRQDRTFAAIFGAWHRGMLAVLKAESNAKQHTVLHTWNLKAVAL